jgi:hypothetical protein
MMEKYDYYLTTPPEPESKPCSRCQFDVYSNENLCKQCQEDDVKMLNLVEQIKGELMSRYNLKEDQIKLRLDIDGLEKAAAQEILSDYSRYGETPEYFFRRESSLQHRNDSTLSNSFYTVTTFIKKEE